MAKNETKSVETAPVETASPAKVAFAALIEAYKKQNPVKYEAKKAALEAKLKSL